MGTVEDAYLSLPFFWFPRFFGVDGSPCLGDDLAVIWAKLEKTARLRG